jgi:hypothetical protein
MVRQVLSGHEKGKQEDVRAYVLRACVLHLQFLKFPGIAELFAGLRYRVETRHSSDMGDLPLVTISAPLATVRPPDNLVTIASGLTGGASFAEVLDIGSVQNLQDPFRQEITGILKSHGQEL